MSGKPEKPEKTSHFWKTTGLMSIIVALIGLLGILITHWTSGSASGSPQSGSVSSSTNTKLQPETQPTGDPANAITSTTITTTPAIRWQGTFSLTNGVDFDSLPPKPQPLDLFIQDDGSGDLYTNGRGSIWTSSSPPTKDQCSDQVDTHAATLIPVSTGTQVCFQTSMGRIAYFKVTSATDGSNSFDYELNAVVWAN